MNYKQWLITITLVGTLFSGYLSFTKLVGGYCPINEGCPTLWSYPVCVYGFILFLVLFLSSVAFYYKDNLFNNLIIAKTSFIGVLFSLYYALVELFFTARIGPVKYSLGLPTCLYGLFMFAAIFIIIMRHKKISPIHVMREVVR
jgi:hypothetical protein